MNFIEQISVYIQKYAPQYNIKVCSPIIAQAILESASGTSELAIKACNYFGLKYRPNRCPTSCGIYNKIGSEQNSDGSYVSSHMQWMKFKNMDDGVRGYFDFINNPNYSNLKGITNPRIYLENIKKDGYATSLKYVDNLMSVISKYNLTQYDSLSGEKSMKCKVAIDAGHGSETAGKRTPSGYREHWINVKCANYFDIAMKRCGIDTVKIGWNDTNSKDDPDISLGTRQQLIKNNNCDISVSWHANAHGNGSQYTSAQGIETYIHSYTSSVADSKNLADKVHSYLIKGTQQKNRGVKSNNFAMCNCSAMNTKASILIEIGFMTNEYEEALLKSDAFCMECAEEAAQGVCDYLGVNFVNVNNNLTTQIPITPPTSSSNVKELYRVRKSWNDIGSQIGAYSVLDNAKKVCKDGYYVFDVNGNVVYPVITTTPNNYTVYKVKLLKDLDIYNQPNGKIVQTKGAKKGIIYTIVETQETKGRLKSGAGWINVSDKDVIKV